MCIRDMKKMMNEYYNFVSKFIKDISGETPNIETYLYVKDFISKYQLNIEINSKPLKAQIIEVNTLLKFHDTSESKKRSHFEMTYTSVIKLNEEIKDKNIKLLSGHPLIAYSIIAAKLSKKIEQIFDGGKK